MTNDEHIQLIAAALDPAAFRQEAYSDTPLGSTLADRRARALQAAQSYCNHFNELGRDSDELKLAAQYPHYYKDVRHLSVIDVYQVCDLWEISDSSGALQHAIKKLLVSGGRSGGKNRDTDIDEAVKTIQRHQRLNE